MLKIRLPRKVGHFILTRQSGVFHLTDVANAVRWKTPDWRGSFVQL